MDISEIDEKKLRDVLAKVKEGRAAFVKNISSCEINRDKVKPYRLKDGDMLWVDKELDLRILDNMNANKNIEVESVCSGHAGESPTVGFNYKGKRSISDVKNVLTKIPDTNVTYDSQIVRVAVPLKKEFKIERDGEEYTLCGLKDIHQDYFFIRGTQKGNKTWWNKVSSTLSKLK